MTLKNCYFQKFHDINFTENPYFSMITQKILAFFHAILLFYLYLQIVLNKFKMMNNRRLHTYNEAIKALNNLQTNASVLEKVKEERLKRYVNDNLIQMRKYLVKSGLCLDEFKNLNVIHISGTKGKGSTCAFIESILRQNGLKTGFYSSPHLVSVTERIKINGEPISQEIFAENFWSVYNKVAKDQPEKPAYFKFLTVLAFNIFVKEKVDVAVIEVGIGGAYDCTNVIGKKLVSFKISRKFCCK